jgi:hypothetical protein
MKTTKVFEIVTGAVALSYEQKAELRSAIAQGHIMTTVNAGYFKDSSVVDKFLEAVKINSGTGDEFKKYIGIHTDKNKKALCAMGILIVWALYTLILTQTERFGICRGCGKLRNATYGKDEIRRAVKTIPSYIAGMDRK